MTKRFSCLHFIRELRAELGGVVAAGIDLCQSMASRGRRVVLATCDAQDVPAHWNEPGGNWPEVIELPPSRMTGLLLSRESLAKFAEIAATVDVAHLHTPWDLCNFQLAKRLRSMGVPYIVTPHGMLDDWSMRQKSLKKRTFLALGGRQLFKHAAAVHFTAEAEKEQALHWVPGGERTVTIGWSLDFAAFQSPVGPQLALNAFPKIRPDQRKILFLSRVHPKKGIDLLIAAAAILRQSTSSPFQLLIAGPGDEPYVSQLKSLAAERGVADITHFLGMVHGETKRSLYEAADVFVLPTHQENFGIVLAEAMACGAPVVTTRGTDIWHELEAGGARIVNHDPQEIADAIQEFIDDPERARAVGRQGQRFVNEWLDPDRVAAAYEQMYREVIATRSPLAQKPMEYDSGKLSVR